MKIQQDDFVTQVLTGKSVMQALHSMDSASHMEQRATVNDMEESEICSNCHHPLRFHLDPTGITLTPCDMEVLSGGHNEVQELCSCRCFTLPEDSRLEGDAE